MPENFENYSGREIAESLQSLRVESGAEPLELPPDVEILRLLEESGSSLIHLYEGWLRESGVDTTLRSYLSPERQIEIVRALVADIPALIKMRNDRQAAEKENPPEKKNPAEAQWVTLATTPPVIFEYGTVEESELLLEKIKNLGLTYKKEETVEGGVRIKIIGCRVSFAFLKKACDYREECKGGCRFCGLSQQNKFVGKITTLDQLAALDDALSRSARVGNIRTVFEILPDGSFLNDFEVQPQVQSAMMKRLSEEQSICKVAVETRPEYCTAQKIRTLLSNLRPDQQLNIYFGLETTDDFVSAVIHRKGYGFKYFKDRLQKVWADLSEKERAKVKFSVYNIIKPAYLSEQESIALSVHMAEDIEAFSQELGVPIDIKYEPSVVTAGTAQDYLYHQNNEQGERRFQPLSYFSVAELIAELAEKKLDHLAKFGQRDDIDEFSTVSMVQQLGNEKMFSQIDFMVYNAVQRFNTDKDLRGFAVDMKIAVENTPEFREWEMKYSGVEGGSSLSKLLKMTFTETAGGRALDEQEKKRIDFQKKVYMICDDIEYNRSFSDSLRIDGPDKEGEIREQIAKLFEDVGIEVFEIKKFVLLDVGFPQDERLGDEADFRYSGYSQKAGFQTEIIIMNEVHQPQSVWIKIPLLPAQIPDRPSYIYS